MIRAVSVTQRQINRYENCCSGKPVTQRQESILYGKLWSWLFNVTRRQKSPLRGRWRVPTQVAERRKVLVTQRQYTHHRPPRRKRLTKKKHPPRDTVPCGERKRADERR